MTNKYKEDAFFTTLFFILLLGIILIFFVQKAEGAEIDINKIILIESSGDSKAYNRRTDARGLMQITPICLLDYNNNNKQKYTKNQLFNPLINRKIGIWYLTKKIPQYLKYYKIKNTTRNVLICFHDGIGNLRKYLDGKRKLGKEMLGYLKKYNK